MKTTNKGLTAILGIALLCACAAPAAADDNAKRELANAREMLEHGQAERAAASLEKALPSMIVSRDFRSASRAYLELAVARDRQNDSDAACDALWQSLDYYREALAMEGLSADAFGNRSRPEAGDGMREVSAKFGCAAGA